MSLTSLIAIGAGLFFGFLLQRSQVICYDRQLEVLLVEDLTVLKFMLSAMVTSMVGIQFLISIGVLSLSVEPSVLGNNVVGGLIFGTGWALLGYGPATVVGAFGEGRIDAFFGILGMILGAIVYFELYPFTRLSMFCWGKLDELTLPGITGTNPWLWVTGIVVLSIFMCYVAERSDL